MPTYQTAWVICDACEEESAVAPRAHFPDGTMNVLKGYPKGWKRLLLSARLDQTRSSYEFVCPKCQEKERAEKEAVEKKEVDIQILTRVY
jgi:hypothetical protein